MAARMLRHARRSAGLTQRALSARTGVPQETIARIEAARADPRITMLDRLLEGCGYGLEHLPRLGIGIDRAQIRERLALSPNERLVRAVEEDRLMTEFRSNLRRVAVGGAPPEAVPGPP